MLVMFGLDISRITTRTKQKPLENLWLDRKKTHFDELVEQSKSLASKLLFGVRTCHRGPLPTVVFPGQIKAAPEEKSNTN